MNRPDVAAAVLARAAWHLTNRDACDAWDGSRAQTHTEEATDRACAEIGVTATERAHALQVAWTAVKTIEPLYRAANRCITAVRVTAADMVTTTPAALRVAAHVTSVPGWVPDMWDAIVVAVHGTLNPRAADSTRDRRDRVRAATTALCDHLDGLGRLARRNTGDDEVALLRLLADRMERPS